MKRTALIFFLIGMLAFIGVARAQTLEDYRQRQADLVTLSLLFGELHHIRRHCAPRRESDIWRERMKKLIELEEPPKDQREAMISAFNRQYRAAQSRFFSCDRRARRRAADSAERGQRIVARLSAPLVEAKLEQEQQENAPFVWSDGSNE